MPLTAPAIGSSAETKACRYLWRRGWRICARNWIGGGGELDIIASRWKTLLVAEVRYRTAGNPLLSIDGDKIERTRLAARALIRRHNLERYHLRFDLIGIDAKGAVSHQKDIDQLPGVR